MPNESAHCFSDMQGRDNHGRQLLESFFIYLDVFVCAIGYLQLSHFFEETTKNLSNLLDLINAFLGTLFSENGP